MVVHKKSGGEDGCEGMVKSIIRTNLLNCWSGKFYICKEKGRKFKKPLAMATMH